MVGTALVLLDLKVVVQSQPEDTHGKVWNARNENCLQFCVCVCVCVCVCRWLCGDAGEDSGTGGTISRRL